MSQKHARARTSSGEGSAGGGDARSPRADTRGLGADAAELCGVLAALERAAREATATIAPLLEAASAGRVSSAGGLSYLDVKVQLLLSYLLDTSFYCLLRAAGHTVAGHAVVGELVHVRTLLDKMRPLDAKLRPQIDRLMRLVSRDGEGDGGGGAGDAGGDASLRPRLEALAGAAGALGGQAAEGTEGDAAYVPARRAEDLYRAGEVAGGGRAAREAARRAARLEASSVVRELREEFSEAPVEVSGRPVGVGRGAAGANEAAARVLAKLDAAEAARTAFEEDMFVRLPVGKAEKGARRRAMRESQRWDTLADIDDFEGAAPGGGGGGGDDGAGGPPRKRRSLADVVSQVEAAGGGGRGMDEGPRKAPRTGGGGGGGGRGGGGGGGGGRGGGKSGKPDRERRRDRVKERGQARR